jgi:pimeloyl-ACP methyl ester carboxylesterase
MSHEAALTFTASIAECTISKPLKKWFLATEHSLGPIECPVRVAWSADDALIPLDPYGARFTTLVPNADRIVQPDVGHVPM